MKKQLFLFAMMLLPLVASAHDIEVNNAYGVTIYYNYTNNGTELEVTFRGSKYYSYSNEYQGNVVIPEEVTYGNKTLKVTSIGDGAFYDCYGLTSITIPNSVTRIGSSAFYKCSGLTSITIPNSVTSIGSSAFRYCSGLTSITIPNSVTSIGKYAFSGCSGLTSITIPNSVTSIGDYAFENCSGLTKVILNSNAFVSKSYSSSSTINSIFGSQVKEYILGEDVTSIGNYAFYGCSGLTSITIPNSVTSIGYAAFRECSGLTSITIPNSVTFIGYYAFVNCSGLTSITIPNSVTSIGNHAFWGCSGLTSITIGNSVTGIGNHAFSYCSGLTSIIVEPGNTEYDSRNNCNAIIKTSTNSLILGCKNTIIPNSVTSIGDFAFYYCSGLTSITIPNSVTSIGDYAFESCSGLTSITIPNSVTSIGDYAFDNCSSLHNVYCYAEQVPATGSNVFSYISQSTLHVPANVVNVYQNTFPWNGFGAIVAIDDTEMPKCEKPTISYENGRLTFDCETDDVEFVYDVVPAPGVSGKGNGVEIKPMFTVSVYATKNGYKDSEVTTKEISVEGGSGMKGDVNGDGEVGIGDIISITNIMAE